jgi:hypothetical protein
LSDAKYFQIGGAPIPQDGGIWWRGRISAVSGFFIGKLSAG